MTKFLTLMALLISTTAHGVTVTCDTGFSISTKKVAHFPEIVTPKGAARFLEEVQQTAGQPGDRLVLIDSDGGSVEAGNILIATGKIERSIGVKTICFVVASAHSMAFNYLTFCDVRLASAKALMVVHKVRLMVDAREEGLTEKLLRKHADEIAQDDEPFRQANAKAMGLTIPEYDEKADAETQWRATTLRKRGYLHGLCTLTK